MSYGIFNVRINVNACDCAQVVYGHRKRVCTESWLWEKNPLARGGIEPVSAACRSDAVPTELYPHPPFHNSLRSWAQFYKAIRSFDTHKFCTTSSPTWEQVYDCLVSRASRLANQRYDVSQGGVNIHDRVSLDVLPRPEWTPSAYTYYAYSPHVATSFISNLMAHVLKLQEKNVVVNCAKFFLCLWLFL